MSMNGRVNFRWAWLDLVDADPTLSGNAHHAAYVLARKYVNTRTLEAYVSQETLANTMHRERHLVGRALHELVEKGFLSVRYGSPASKRGRVYALRPPNLNGTDSSIWRERDSVEA
jgi:hypothetical protein